MATVSIYGVTCTVNAITTLITSALISTPAAVAFDAAGNLYSGQYGNNDINIMPAATAAVFGVSCTQNTFKTLWTTSLTLPLGVSFDPAGNLYITNYGGSNHLMVLPKASGTIFGHSVTANTLYTLATGLTAQRAARMDSAGNLWALSGTTLSVIPVSTGTLFGVSVTANTLTSVITSGLTLADDLCFDSAGDIYIADYSAAKIWVLPVATGTIFGQSVTANTLHSLGAVTGASGCCMDPAGNLYIGSAGGSNTVQVISATTTTLYGVSCTANTMKTLISVGAASSYVSLDSAGNLYIGGNGIIYVLAAAAWPPVPSYTGAASQAVAFATSASVPVSSAFLSFFP